MDKVNDSNYLDELFISEAKSALSNGCNCTGDGSGSGTHTVKIVDGVLYILFESGGVSLI